MSEEVKNVVPETEWNITGMTCSNCAMTVTKYLQRNGAQNVFVDFAAGTARFNANGNFTAEQVKIGIASLGYKVLNRESEKRPAFLCTVESKFLFCLIFTVPLLLHMLPITFLHSALLQLVLCIPVMLVGWWYFGRSAWGSVRESVPNMDVLIVIGSTAAFIYSLIGGVFMKNADYLFFETAASIITLVLLGNVIEKRSVKKTRGAVEELAKLQPQYAKRIDFYGDEKFEVIAEVHQDDLAEGQYLLVNTGDRIPADGIVVWGNASVDESMISGESIPVEKKINDPVISGTVVKDGTVKMKVTAVGKNTVLSSIIEMVNDAQRNKPRIQKLADRITAVFVPVVLSIAAITFLVALFSFNLSFQKALMNSIGVLVISCPCAMGLATPTAVMVGIGRAARKGILIRAAQTIETFASVKTIVFDKTGTLTTGLFKIKNLETIGITSDELRSIIASIETFSSHPIAKSISEELRNEKIFSVKDVAEEKGVCIRATDNHSNSYAIGSSKILNEKVTDVLWNVFVTKNNTLVGKVEVRDITRAEAKATIDYLHDQGIKTIMLSGDKENICREVANELRLDAYYSEKMPDEKLSIIHDLLKEGIVAMVGDGINDAPALTAATIGISLSNATQVAVDAAQIILLQNDLALLSEALRISKHTLKTIRQNLFWAFFYNTVAIPIAAFGFLKPILAALSMAFSDVIVIGNSLRLRFRKLE